LLNKVPLTCTLEFLVIPNATADFKVRLRSGAIKTLSLYSYLAHGELFVSEYNNVIFPEDFTITGENLRLPSQTLAPACHCHTPRMTRPLGPHFT